MVVVVKVCWLCVVPEHWFVRWQGLVVVIGAPVVHVMVWCGLVRRVGWVKCRGWLRWGVVVMELVGVAVVLVHRAVGVVGGGSVVMVLVAPRSLALREWWSLYGVDLCGQWSWPGCWIRLLRYSGHRGRWWDWCCWCALGGWEWGGAAWVGLGPGRDANPCWWARWRAPWPVLVFLVRWVSGAGDLPWPRRGDGERLCSSAPL